MNKCEECQVCCKVLEIKNFKESMTKCQYLNSKGCSIYKKRPKGCSHFKCAWLLSEWPKEFRPDLSGIMVCSTKEGTKSFRCEDKVNDKLMNILISKKIKGIDAREVIQ